MVEFLERLQNIDRRWIFLGMGLSILLPMLVPFSLPFRADRAVRDIYDRFELLEAGQRVYLSLDLDPASRPELEPFLRATLRYLFAHDIKVVSGTLWDYAPGMVIPILEEEAERAGKKKYDDWVFMGLLAGKELAIKNIAENFRQAYPKDYWQKPIGEIALLDGINQVKDFELLILSSAGFPGTREWVLLVQAQYDLEMASSTTAVSTPDYVPYYKAGQLFGLAGGMPGSAQFEQLVGPEVLGPAGGRDIRASQGVNVLMVGHLFIIAAIIVGNLAMFLTGGFRREEEQA
jgi:hypothetical protein